ncbi:MAG: winged helix-turn-helix transcriptional regulator [Candidatus Thermoplasmatota archaeon]|nr:winged helix-turn-helix transcriptional regulator [Candidatus Thermoplasmatota archaeon]
MTKWTKIIAAVLAIIAIALLAYAILNNTPTDTTEDQKGMWDNVHTYSTSNLALIILASLIIAVAVMFILLREEYVPLPPSMTLPPPPEDERALVTKDKVASPKSAVEEEKVSSPVIEEATVSEDKDMEERYLALRLLSGDERTMFKSVMDSGGEALQKDLMQRTKMSNAKVSRVLERLEQKGVISKERHGSTNKIRINLRR